MRTPTLLALALLVAPVLLADEHHIDFDAAADFSTVKSFTIMAGRANSRRPEIDNPITLKTIGDSIRSVLSSKGLKEVTNGADVIVNFSIATLPYRAAGRRGSPVESGFRGTFVIDLTKRDGNKLLWRGVYTDDESDAAKLAKKLPSDAKKLLSEYPPKKKK